MAKIHVRCPVAYCGQTLDVDLTETWGEVDPLDHGCVTVTLTGDGGMVRKHLNTHTVEAINAARQERLDAFAGRSA